jgi:hypothetical protein
MADESLQAPNLQTIGNDVPAVSAAADGTTIIGKVPFAGVIKSVIYTPAANITGANTETRTLSLINKGQDGNGSTVIATLPMTSGVNSLDFDDKTIPLSGTVANLNVAQGDVLAWTSVHSGSTGLADPGGYVEVGVDRF